MKIKKIKLKNYRNCENIDVEINNKKVLFIGKNAQGKTNILESIYFLSTLKSHRTTNNQELIKFEKEKMEIYIILEKNGVLTELENKYDKNKKKEFLINKVKTSKVKEFKNIIKTVMFSAQDLLLIRGNPQERRDWLDDSICLIYPAFEERLYKYNKIKTQKNNLLKEPYPNDILLEVYNEQLCILGSNIIYLRKKFLKEIEKIAKEKQLNINQEEDLSIKYICDFLKDEEFLEVKEIAKRFKQNQEEKILEEKRRGQTLVGPHKDDICFSINNKEASKYASQGQQRTIVLSLKMAELELLYQKTGDYPILLLDDVLAELDDKRQQYLLNTIDEKIQTVITSVDTLLFDKKFLENITIFKVEKGCVYKNNTLD